MRLWLAAGALLALLAWALRSLAPVSVRAAPKGRPDPETAARLRKSVETLAGEIGERNHYQPANLARAEAYVLRELKAAGRAVAVHEYSVRPPTSAKDVPARNFEIVVPAAVADAPVLVIGAHYDTAAGTRGADDNASGVAVLLELARRLKGRAPGAVELRLVAFGTEEPPYFYTGQEGSAAHAKALKASGRTVLGMISLEMLGFYSEAPGSQRYPAPLSYFYPATADFVGVVGTWGPSRAFLKHFASLFLPPAGTRVIASCLPRAIGEINLSDHYNYWKQGFPALMLTDTSFLRYPHYHEMTDTPEKLDYARMADVAAGLETAVIGLLSAGR